MGRKYLRVRNLIKWIYKTYGRNYYFVSNQVLRNHYTPYPVTRGAIYTAIHRAWKMGLLSRKKYFGNSYQYRLTKWAVRYIEEGDRYREDEIWLKLLKYINEFGDIKNREWAESVLAPRLLKRFFPGRKAQDIQPIIDFPEAFEKSISLLENRIRNESVEMTDDFEDQNYFDFITLSLVSNLLDKLYPTEESLFDSEMIILNQMERGKVLDKAINEILHPKQNEIWVTNSNLGSTSPLKLETRFEYGRRPTTKDKERLSKLVSKLRILLNETRKTEA